MTNKEIDLTRRKTVAIIHPWLRCAGGSEAQALWIAEALKSNFDLTLVTMGTTPLEDLNRYYGTSLDPGAVRIVRLKVPAFLRRSFDALRGYRLARYCRTELGAFDVLIMTYNVFDFGRRSIQFIGDFSFDDTLRRRFDQATPGFRRALYQKTIFRDLYLKLGEVLSRETRSGWMNNLTVANSFWSQGILKAAFGIDSPVIYPPVQGQFPPVPWEKRENGFVVLGRIEPEKRIERIVGILQGVRAKGFPLHLHVVGSGRETSYSKNIRRLCARYRAWMTLDGVKGGFEKDEFLARHKYGISGRQNEPFGIAVAEMILAGCIVWVPDGGGQVEIVDHPSLTYSSLNDAQEKIERLLKDRDLQFRTRQHLAERAALFSVARFKIEIQNIVSRFLENQQPFDAVKAGTRFLK
jgi:glycosyltransferase involved in cell wall biosynthesis